MSENSFLGLGAYLKKINDTYDKTKSVTEILDNFRCISKEYQDFSCSADKDKHYSSYKYSECSDSEKLDFEISEYTKAEPLIDDIADGTGFDIIFRKWKSRAHPIRNSSISSSCAAARRARNRAR